VCFPLNVLMVHSLKSDVVIDGNHQTNLRFALGKTIRFGSLEFIANHFGGLSLSPERNDSCVIFVRMGHNRSPSLHTILEEDIASSGEGSSDFPIS
jgi:hypothetical protein